MSMVWTPLYVSAAEKAHSSESATFEADGEPLVLVFAESQAARRAFGVESAGGESGRRSLERALASNIGLAVAIDSEPRAPRAVVNANEVTSLLALEQKNDPVLGIITWYPMSDDKGFWRFEAGPVGNHSVAGVVVPDSPWEPIRDGELPRIRKTVLWVRENDGAIRAHIAAEMWDWWFNEYCDPSDRETIRTPKEFCEKLELEAIRFEPGADARLAYADHELVGGYGIHINVNHDGRFTRGPEMG
jgi:hypothetical protein